MRRSIPGAVVVVAALATPFAVGGATASRPTARCSAIPVVPVGRQDWGFHAGHPISGSSGTYTRGHGKIDLSAKTVSGEICQVDRVAGGPDRQIVLSVDRRLSYASHHARMFGVEGNIMKIRVRVKSTTDPACAVGTRGAVTIFASYNGIQKDSVEYKFPVACSGHRHRYTGSDVITNVPPN